jgi:hypothetical protein
MKSGCVRSIQTHLKRSPNWHEIGCKLTCFSASGREFFQRYRIKRAEEIEPPALEPPPLPKEEKTKTTDTVKAIQVSDAQYVLLTRALRPVVAPVLKDLQVDVPGSNVPAVVGEASQPPPANPRAVSPDRPPGTPIV